MHRVQVSMKLYFFCIFPLKSESYPSFLFVCLFFWQSPVVNSAGILFSWELKKKVYNFDFPKLLHICGKISSKSQAFLLQTKVLSYIPG